MQQSHLILWNALTSYGRAAIQTVVGVVLIPYVIHRIGTASYGVVVLAMSTLDVVELVGRGFGKAVTVHVAEQRARQNHAMLGEIYASSLLWFAAVGLAGSAIAVVIGWNFELVFTGTDPALVEDARLAMFVIAAAICPSVISDVHRSILAADQKYDLINAFGVARALSRLVLIVAWFELREPSLLAVAAIYAASHLIERLGVTAICMLAMPELRARLAGITRGALRLIVGFAGFYLLVTVGNALALHALKFVIGRSLGMGDVGRYQVAFTLMGFGSLMVNNFVNVLTPVASKYQGLEDHEPIRKLVIHGTKYATVMVMACLGITAPFIPELLRLYVGAKFVSLSLVVAVMFAAQICYSASVCANQVLTGLGEVRVIGVVTWTWASGGLAGSALYLYAWPAPGLLGVVVIMGIARSVAAAYVMAYTIRRLELAARRVVWESLAVPALLALPLIAAGMAASEWLAITSWPRLALAVSALLVVYVAALARWSFDDEEWARARHLARRLAARFGRRGPGARDG